MRKKKQLKNMRKKKQLKVSRHAVANPSVSNAFSLTTVIHIDAKEMGTWEPERILDFFSGIARVIQARRGR